MNGNRQILLLTLFSQKIKTISQKLNWANGKKLSLVIGMFFVSLLSFGQTGPAGVDYANLRLWLDGSDPAGNGTTPAAGPITSWTDKSSYNELLDGPGGSPPLPNYTPSEPTFNGAGVFVFDSTVTFRDNTVGNWTEDHTIFIVFMQDTIITAPGTALFSSGDDGAGNGGVNSRFEIQVGAGLTDYTFHTTGTGSNECVFGGQAAALAGPVMYSATRSGNNVSCYNNGVLASTMVTTTGESFNEYILNQNREENIGNNCKIAEVIIYSKVLSAVEMARINNYLACKYNVAIAGVAPGGADPCDVSLWMRADFGTDATAQSDPVSTWADQGFFNFDGTAPGGEEPSFNTMDNNFNPSLSFDTTGAGQAIGLGNAVAADGLVIGGGEFSIYSVVSVDTTSPIVDGVLYADNLCTDNNGYNVTFNSTTDSWKFSGVGASGTNIGTAETPNTSSSYSLLKLNRTGANYNAQTNENAVSSGMSSGTINFNPTMPTERWIGKEYNGTCSSDNFQGKLSELIVIKGTVPAAEDKQIQSYLALKYGLTLPVSTGTYVASDGVTDLWINTAVYWNGIAGIGQDDGSFLDQRISKSQSPEGIVTIASTNDFTLPNNDPARDSLENGNFLVWGNNGNSASGGWTLTDAPANFAVIPETWLTRETGTVGPVSIQVNVDNTNNDIPDFFGDLYFVHGPTLSSATPDTMTMTSPGVWTIDGIDLGSDELFTFAVENRLLVEFSSNVAASSDEAIADGFPALLADGIMNIPTTCGVFNSGGGTAGSGGVDYTFSDTTYTITAGIYTVDSLLIDPPVLTNDIVPENLETIIFSIDNGGSNGISVGDADGSTTTFPQHTYTITDDDSYGVSIQAISDGEEGVTDAVFRVFLTSGSNPSPTDITGEIIWSGTATGGNGTGDYDNTVTTFTIPPGFTDSTINLSTSLVAYDDILLEGTETIIGTLSNLSLGSVPSPTASTDTAFVIDNEMTDIIVSIDTVANSGTALEGFGFSYRISLENNVINNSDSIINGAINFSGTAAASDYTNQTTFTIPIGSSSTVINYSATGDNEVELTETVIAQISLLNGVGTTDVLSDTARAFILDEDTTGLTMSIGVVGGGAGPTESSGGSSIDYSITLSGGKTNGTGMPITGQITFSGSAIAGTDYTDPGTPFSIPYNAGAVTGVGIYNVPILNDAVPEPTDLLTATISSPSIGTTPSPNNTINQNIFDDDSPGLQIAIGSPVNAEEGGAPPLDTVYFTISIVAGGTSASDITGTIDYSSGSAVPGAGNDFIAVPNYTIPAGQTSTTIALAVVDDGITEPTETVVALLTGTPSLGSYNNTSSSATITDDDASSLMMSIDTVIGTGYEDGTTDISFVISLDFFAVNGTGSDIFGSIQFGGSAVNGSDYTGAPVNFSISNMQSTDTITLTVVDDILLEYTDSIIAIISSPTIGSVSNGVAVAYIVDNDLDSLSISIAAQDDGLEDGLIPASFIVSIDNGLENGLGVNLTGNVAYSGDANPGLDFSNVLTFAIPPNSSFVELELPVVDDQDLEVTESLIATISDLLIAGATNPNANFDTVYIIDNDISGAQFAIEKTSDGIESPFPSVHPQFTVSIVGGGENQTGLPITGVLELTGTAMEGAGLDYSNPNPPGVFNIPNNSSGQVIDLLVQDDNLEELSETIIATISMPSIGMISLTDSLAIATIADDDTDTDNDGLVDLLDSNDVNIDTDCDGIFDGCDADHDGDGIIDQGLDDVDGDGIHDGCDASIVVDGVIDNGPDINLDDLNDVAWDPTDDDGDLLPNHVDPNDNNPDTDGDGIPDGADVDVNGDGVFDNGCDVDDDGINNVADSDDNPTDGQTDVGNLDEDLDGIDNYWDLVNDNAGGQAINYIVTPDGDGVNETLRIKGINFFENHELIIFNRWGSPIYRTRNYQQDWAGKVTEGIQTGTEPLSDGTYFYTLDLGNGQEFVRGFIEIRR